MSKSRLCRSALAGSAICIYTVDELQRVFTSAFLTQKSNESFWLPSAMKQDAEKVSPHRLSLERVERQTNRLSV